MDCRGPLQLNSYGVRNECVRGMYYKRSTTNGVDERADDECDPGVNWSWFALVERPVWPLYDGVHGAELKAQRPSQEFRNTVAKVLLF